MGDGVQLFVSFALPQDLAPPTEVFRYSDALHTRGAPFEDLGPLQVVPVTYESFGPPLFDLEADGPPSPCEREIDAVLRCDVTSSVTAALASGRDRAQFRLRFERAGGRR